MVVNVADKEMQPCLLLAFLGQSVFGMAVAVVLRPLRQTSVAIRLRGAAVD
jgi:hypothetical protein